MATGTHLLMLLGVVLAHVQSVLDGCDGELARDRRVVAARRRQVVPQRWMDDATTTRVRTSSRRLPGFGYGFWTGRAQGLPVVAATGRGGQLVEVLPALDAVIVVACDDVPNPSGAGAASSESFVEGIESLVLPGLR